MKSVNVTIFLFLILAVSQAFAQQREGMTITTEVPTTSVKNQGRTGTCWCFATLSFIESEALRQGKDSLDLSEMFVVWHTYLNKVETYVRLHGHNNFSEGGQAHDVLNVVQQHGIVTEEDFSGYKQNGRYTHKDLMEELEPAAKALAKKEGIPEGWQHEFVLMLNKHIGTLPEKVTYKRQKQSPQGFMSEQVAFFPDNYIELTSYSHHPYYKPFALEVPDNWSHDLYYNLPIDELMQVMTHALKNGYSVAWDGDVSESTFNNSKGLAILPDSIETVTQELRQETFNNRSTTDDHLMHIVGIAKDDTGKEYFLTKNSWGSFANPYNGYLYLSFNYVALQTIAILIHKESLPENIANKLKLIE